MDKGGGSKGGKGQQGQRTQLNHSAAGFQPGFSYPAAFQDPSWAWSQGAPEVPTWLVYADPEGTPYYYNCRTGLSQWDKPEELRKKDREKNEAKIVSAASGLERTSVPREGGKGGQKGSGSGGKGGSKQSKGNKDTSNEADFGPPGCNLFVFHLPDDWQDDDLHEYFAPHGAVASAKVMKETGTGRSRGFGFVSYQDAGSASTALQKMQGYKILGKRLKVEYKKGEGGPEQAD